ncbi:MAG TPA: peptidylprolyl isomerase [Kiritimatiellia bacterium]|nr:peptidylprolyl isomerase [Kiritimatiellia bacterium]HSA19360.1 peptidylprolyl isomerase [Kiritimatiellia bacterium]
MKRHSEKTWHWARWILAATALVAFPLTGCGQKEEPAAQADADLSQPGDLFSQPIRSVAPERADEEAIATVNGESITWGEVRREVDRALKVAEQRQVPPEQIAQMRGQVTRQAAEALVVKRLLLGEADQQKVELTEQEIEEARAEFTGRFPAGMTLEDALAKQGISKEEFDTEFVKELRINKLVEAQTAKIVEPTEEEVAKFYEDHKDRMDMPETVTASHILIAVAPDATEDAKKAAKAKADEVRAKLVEGGDFAALAKEYSDCPSKARGGALPRFGRGDMVKPFEDAAFAQKVDEVGPVVETQFGYHIIKVGEHAEPHVMTLEEVREDLVRGMKAQKRQLAVREYIDGIKGKAEIKFLGAASLPAPMGMPMMAPPPAATEAAPAPDAEPAASEAAPVEPEAEPAADAPAAEPAE